MKGRCACGSVEIEILREPLIVHCCHCTNCQRESGSAFALNVMIESENLRVTGETARTHLPAGGPKGQASHACLNCRQTLWTHYGAAGAAFAFVRAGVLDERASIEPDVHIYTSTKLPWVVIPKGVRTFEAYYNPKETWSLDAQERFRAVKR